MNLPSHWYAIALSTEVPLGKPVALERFGKALVLWRKQSGQLVVMEDRCPHRFAQLSLGEIAHDQLQCPFHGFRFDSEGSCQYVPELDRAAPKLCVKAYVACEQSGWIWLWWGSGNPQREVPRWFEQITPKFSTALMKERWSTHLSRSIENQLDYVHLPYVHRKTIGRFVKSVQKRPIFQMNEERIHWTFEGGAGTYIEYRFPNIWVNQISDQYLITLAFVPVNETTTELYLQSHQSFVRIPGLRGFIDRLMIVMNRKILNEDHNVVLSQKPIDVREAGDEILFPSDRAIQYFRRWLSGAKDLKPPTDSDTPRGC